MKQITLLGTKNLLLKQGTGQIFVDGVLYDFYLMKAGKPIAIPAESKEFYIKFENWESNRINVQMLSTEENNTFTIDGKVSNTFNTLAVICQFFALLWMMFSDRNQYYFWSFLLFIPILIVLYTEFFRRKGYIIVKKIDEKE